MSIEPGGMQRRRLLQSAADLAISQIALDTVGAASIKSKDAVNRCFGKRNTVRGRK